VPSGPADRIVVMGVSGSGKSSVGEQLARDLRYPFVEGDALHARDAILKMTSGQPLTDADRMPWLERVGRELAVRRRVVASCSALTVRYRDVLRNYAGSITFIHLSGHAELLESRLVGRQGHFMPAQLLTSQLELLEPLQASERGVTIDASAPIPDLVRAIRAHALIR
jgi:carbohydrate kinase (thermoresistant glucokinase family)